MKKVLLLTLVMVVSASIAAAQPGALGTYADPGGLNCNVSDAAAGLLSIYVVQTLTGGSTAVEFASPTPACFVAPYLSWSSPFGVSVGDPVTPGGGNSTAYGACLPGTILVGTMSYFAQALTGPCCAYPIIPHQVTGSLVAVDCAGPTAIPMSGLANTVNGNVTCDCNTVPTQDATWGAVKSLYQ
jgi:hypothetical protein